MEREGARWRIGPLTAYVPAADIERWHLRARPGEATHYAIGPALGRDPVVTLVRELQRRGTAGLFLKREGTGLRYMIRKLESSPAATAGRGAAGSGDSPAAPQPGSPEGRLLSLLTELAAAGTPCPSNGQLAEQLDFARPQAVAYRLQLLRDAGLIAVSECPSGERSVTITATGQATACPVAGRAVA